MSRSERQDPPSSPQPPSAPETEEALLGSLLIDPALIVRIAAKLRPADFYRERHGAIYAAMLKLTERGDTADFLTLTDYLDQTNRLNEVGGTGYIAGLANATPTPAYAEHYAARIERLAMRRKLLALAGRLSADAYQSDDPDETIGRTESALYELRGGRQSGKLISPRERLDLAWARYEAAQSGQTAGVPYGFFDLDHVTGGAHKGELILVAGRPSQGKSSCMQTMAEYQAATGRHVLFCSAEMPEAQLTERYVAAEVGSTVHALQAGDISQDTWTRIAQVIAEHEGRIPYVYDDGGMTTTGIRALATEMRSRVGLDIIYVDYLQILHDKHEDPVARVSLISRQLLALARTLNVPVVAGSQLNRQSEGRTDKMPELADLRESGSLEQDSHVVLILFRPAYYFTAVDWARIAPNEQHHYHNTCKVIVAKQRNGPRGVHVWLQFTPETTRFRDLSDRREEHAYR